MGLAKQHRLKHRHDFNRVYQQGTRFKSSVLTLRVVHRAIRQPSNPRLATEAVPPRSVNADLGKTAPLSKASLILRQNQRSPALPTRLGISISTKVDKRSVVRNRIRRQLQALFRQLLPRVVPGWDVLIVVHPAAVQCDYSQFLRELEQLLLEAKVIHGDPRGCVL